MRCPRIVLVLGLLLAAVGLCLPAFAQAKRAAEQPQATQPLRIAGPTSTFKTPRVGQQLFVEWGRSYWLAQVTAVHSSRVTIHYVGWGNQWDEVVGPDRLALETKPPARPYRPGDRLFVAWGGSYWPAEVTAVHGARVAIHYVGYGNQWDEVVGPDRIKHLRPAIKRPPLGKLKAGDHVQVSWGGQWWPATIVAVQGRDRYLIHYDGYGNEWDEVVGPDRIRRP